MVRGIGGTARAAVVGAGLIGGSVLLRLRDAGLDVAGWDPDPTTRRYVRERGLACPDTAEEAVAGRDVVFLCGPLPSLPEMLCRVAVATDEECVLTDVGSTKAELAAFAAARGVGHRFVPGHPMAGAERAGVTSASPTLLDRAAWVLCPGPTGMPAFRRLAPLIIEAFRARLVPMSPEQHDTVVALSSHVPHLLAGALAGAAQEAPLRDAVLGLAAGSFRDGSRVAATPAERTANMLLGNRERVIEELARVTAFLDGLAGAVRAGDAAALTSRYRVAASARAALSGRRFVSRGRRFPVAGDVAVEVAYLWELGAAGGHLSGCRVDAGTVSYVAHLPADPEPA
ncbi:prephenate dehydrogenase/arogenate dehydrogenase family protein [Micromonospora sp. C31]|uniref:prephenate dehydrogenase n=1 Tax=Micromonospora sp. C31 TaxID=2824876 RepID=UPI001B3820AC|nr:prephenate dehydrogenase/arogenate dehydrogenase family protein [Micromonospora sp. C31]MBQ1071901.1 prephenate dehydrogenase/arogenate dehydrogenase family protein [Micromonospora sp. C31]